MSICKHFNLIIVLLLLLNSLSDNANGENTTISDDAKGLIALKNAVDVTNSLSWDIAKASNVCKWTGISCINLSSSEYSPRVVSVRLPASGLTGKIPENSISLLTELRILSLRSNKLSGPIPADLAKCNLLRSLYLQHNNFSGPLPLNFNHWPNMLHIDLSYNSFTSSVPSSIASLSHLKSLLLQNNSLSGILPDINTPTLSKFNVSNNKLQGAIPSSLNFTVASFMGNELCGSPLPPCISSTAADQTPASITSHPVLPAPAVAGIAIGAAMLLLIIIYIFCRKGSKDKTNKKKRKAELKAMEGAPSFTSDQPLSSSTTATNNTIASSIAAQSHPRKLIFFQGSKYSFDLEELLKASAEVLGKGSIGTAYKAVLETGSIVAVKRLRDISIEKQDFDLQMAKISKLKHENLVPFIAYYFSKDEKLLVNEYMTNGSLSSLLHGTRGINHTPLDWEKRIRIAAGIALGLEYLHDHMCIHGNIKSSNILLTCNYTSRVSDYGIAELVSATPAAKRIGGYRAPEVAADSMRRTTHKSDVYSYGVLLLELLTARAPSQDGIDLPKWVESMLKEDNDIIKVFDVELIKYLNDIDKDELVQVLRIAMRCISPSPDQRPSIKDVVKQLEALRSMKLLSEDEDVADII